MTKHSEEDAEMITEEEAARQLAALVRRAGIQKQVKPRSLRRARVATCTFEELDEVILRMHGIKKDKEKRSVSKICSDSIIV